MLSAHFIQTSSLISSEFGKDIRSGQHQLSRAGNVYSTVTDLAKFRGLSTSQPRARAV